MGCDTENAADRKPVNSLRKFGETPPPEPELIGMWLAWSELEALAQAETPRSVIDKAAQILEALRNGTVEPRTF